MHEHYVLVLLLRLYEFRYYCFSGGRGKLGVTLGIALDCSCVVNYEDHLEKDAEITPWGALQYLAEE